MATASGLSHAGPAAMRVVTSRPMRRALFVLVFFVLASCGGKDGEAPFRVSRDPVSVRGWILDVKGAKRGESMEIEVARRAQLFAATSVWVEDVQYASGGVSENGAFVVLDVPPGKAILGFNAPGAESAKLILEGVPGTADVFIPDLILEENGAALFDPSKVFIRLPADVDRPTPTGKTAFVAGKMVPIVETPLRMMQDRREYPPVPGYRPLATVK